MKYNDLTPNMMVDNVEETIAFYSQNLGFSVTQTVPEVPPYNWALIQKDSVWLMLQEKKNLIEEYPNLSKRTLGGSQTFFIKVFGIAELFDDLRTKNAVNIISDYHVKFYGMAEFAIQDPNGYILTFAESVQIHEKK